MIYGTIREEISWVARDLEDQELHAYVQALVEDADTPEQLLWDIYDEVCRCLREQCKGDDASDMLPS